MTAAVRSLLNIRPITTQSAFRCVLSSEQRVRQGLFARPRRRRSPLLWLHAWWGACGSKDQLQNSSAKQRHANGEVHERGVH